MGCYPKPARCSVSVRLDQLQALVVGPLVVTARAYSQGLLAHEQSCGAEPTSCIVHLLKDDGQVWEALHIIKLSLQVSTIPQHSTDTARVCVPLLFQQVVFEIACAHVCCQSVLPKEPCRCVVSLAQTPCTAPAQ